ncbi:MULTISPECIES: AAA family ATPase [Pseudomonas]|uniref:AAA family ATPase n=1 Tax=Pseudomonas TaxID=286 RepID=UPI0014121669|nr:MULTISPECIES: AAA family ATPase [Pseudomonas]CAH0649068.1 hypothetical protein PSNVIR_03338 [Pseudomonas sp. Nvir]
MQLCFIWVKKFKNLENFGISFSDEFDFQFDIAGGNLHRINKNPMPHLFGDNIASITGVLGINGAGKTNLLELICRIVNSSETLRIEYLVIYRAGGNYYQSTNIKHPISADFYISGSVSRDEMEGMDTVFFSNVFDKNFIDFGDAIADVSVNNKNNPRTLARNRETRQSDFVNDIEFFQSSEFESLGLSAPPRIEIRIEKFINRHNQVSRQDAVVPVLNYLAEIRKKNRDRGKLYLVRQTIQMGFLKTLLERDTSEKRLVSDMVHILEERPNIAFEELIAEFRERCSRHNNTIPWSSNLLLHDALTILLGLESFLKEKHFDIDETLTGPKYIFTIDFDPVDSFCYRHLACVIQTLRFGSISWTGVSSGQKAYLNLFSSIWNGVDSYRFRSEKKRTTLICIDEGDLYLHPEWQLEFVERLIKCLPKLSEGTVQVVFTTHSPILISDLPHQCVVVLNKDPEGSADLSNRDAQRHKTFAANLYDIYQYSFGLNHKRSGNLSSSYLREVFKLLDKKTLSQQDTESLSLALSVIDDDVVKFHIHKRIVSE